MPPPPARGPAGQCQWAQSARPGSRWRRLAPRQQFPVRAGAWSALHRLQKTGPHPRVSPHIRPWSVPAPTPPGARQWSPSGGGLWPGSGWRLSHSRGAGHGHRKGKCISTFCANFVIFTQSNYSSMFQLAVLSVVTLNPLFLYLISLWSFSPLFSARLRMFGQLTLEIFMTDNEGWGQGPRKERFIFLLIDVLKYNISSDSKCLLALPYFWAWFLLYLRV